MTRRRLVTLLARAALSAAAAYVVLCSLVPGYALNPAVFALGPWDNLAGFLGLGLLACAAFPRAPLWGLAPVLVALGGGLELLQNVDAIDRGASLAEWGWDSLGVALAMAAARLTPLARWRAGPPPAGAPPAQEQAAA